MARVSFTQNIQRHVHCPPLEVSGATVREALDAYFDKHASVRTYVLDDQGEVRRHMVIFVDGEQINDRVTLSDSLKPDSELQIFQALSGG